MIITDINDNQREAKSVVPDPNYPGFLKIEFLKRSDWYSIKEFLEKNPTLSHLVQAVRPTPEDTLGVVTGATETTITDTKQTLKENAYVGFIAWISRGKGEGQKRAVTANTHNIITVEHAWDIKPDETSQYVLSHNIHDAAPLGNTLPSADIKELEKQAKMIKNKLKKKPVKIKKKVQPAKKRAIQKKKVRKPVTKSRAVARKKAAKVLRVKTKKKIVKKVKTKRQKTTKNQTKVRKPNKKLVKKKTAKLRKKR